MMDYRQYVRTFVTVGSALVLSACASKQLNFNTQDIAAGVADLYTQEVLDNLGRTIADPSAIPSHVDILAGTAQTSNSITPNISFPLSNMFSVAAAAATTRTTTTAGASMGIQASDAWQQNWNLTTISDALVLRNLHALYRHEIVPHCGTTSSATDCSDLMKEYTVPRHYDYSVNITADPFFLLQPQCVICVENEAALQNPNATRFINPDLKDTGWLYWRMADGSFMSSNGRSRPASDEANMAPQGRHAGYELFVPKGELYRLARFVLFTLPVAEPVPPTGAKAPGADDTKEKPPRNGKKTMTLAPATSRPAPGLGGGPAASSRFMGPLLSVPFGIQPTQ